MQRSSGSSFSQLQQSNFEREHAKASVTLKTSLKETRRLQNTVASCYDHRIFRLQHMCTAT
jgi:hypothetical protein